MTDRFQYLPKLKYPDRQPSHFNIEAVREGYAALAAFPNLDDGSQFRAEELMAVRWQVDSEHSIVIHKSHLQATSPPFYQLAAHILDHDTWICLSLAFLLIWLCFVAVSLASSQSLRRTESYHAKVMKVLEISWNTLYRMVAGDFG